MKNYEKLNNLFKFYNINCYEFYENHITNEIGLYNNEKILYKKCQVNLKCTDNEVFENLSDKSTFSTFKTILSKINQDIINREMELLIIVVNDGIDGKKFKKCHKELKILLNIEKLINFLINCSCMEEISIKMDLLGI